MKEAQNDQSLRIQIASPCSADWDKMSGDDRVRFCTQCARHVYNLSALSSSQAQKLVAEKEGKLCARFYRRKDGTVLTDDCPVGLRMVIAGYRRVGAVVASICAMFFSIFPCHAADEKGSTCESDRKASPSPAPPNQPLMGGVAPAPIKQNIDAQQKALDANAQKPINSGKATASDFVQVAWLSYKSGKLDDAIVECNIAISLDPNSTAAYDTRGHLEFDKKQFDNAIADFSKAISIDPTLVSSHYYRAQAYRALGKHELAKTDEAKAKELGYAFPK